MKKIIGAICGLFVLIIYLSFGSCKQEKPNPCSDNLSINSVAKTAAAVGKANGSLVVQAAGGTNIQYSINDSSYQSSGEFDNLSAKDYHVSAKNDKGCISSVKVTIESVADPCAGVIITVNASHTDATSGHSDGTISASVTGGNTGYVFQLNGGQFQSDGNFSNLAAGAYTVTAKNTGGCTGTTQVTVGTVTNSCVGVVITVGLTKIDPSSGQSNGSITASASGGSGFSYSKDGVNFQSSPTFSGLAAGTYIITAKNSNGCTGTAQITLAAGNSCSGVTITVTGTIVNPGSGQSNGSITVAATGGSGFTYSKDGVNFQSSTTFSGLSAGSYVITAKSSAGCTGQNTFTLTAPNSCTGVTITVTGTIVQPGSGQSNGSITVSATGGGTSYTYSKDGVNFQSSTTFSGLAAGSYIITAKNSNGCTGQASFSLGSATDPCTGITVTVSGTITAPTSGQSNGSIVVSATGGSGFTFSKDGVNFQSSNTFSGLPVGTYVITAKNSNGCKGSNSFILSVNDPCSGVTITVTGTITQPSAGLANGAINASASGSTGLTYSLDGGAFGSTTNFTGLAAGSHTVTAKNGNGCSGSATFALVDACTTKTITISAAVTNVLPCASPTNNGSMIITAGGSTGFTYSFNGGASFTGSNSASSLTVGNYKVVVKDGQGCTKTQTVPVGTQVAGPLFTAVKNLIAASCVSCHSSGQNAPDLSVDCNIVIFSDRINVRMNDTVNPMPTSGQLSSTEIKKVTDWVNAGATYNK